MVGSSLLAACAIDSRAVHVDDSDEDAMSMVSMLAAGGAGGSPPILGGASGAAGRGFGGASGAGGSGNGSGGYAGSCIQPDGSVPPADEPLTLSQSNADAVCVAQPEEFFTPLDPGTVRALMVGRWARCSGGADGGLDELLFGVAHDGIELTADGAWFFLRWNAGALERIQGNAAGGQWIVQSACIDYATVQMNRGSSQPIGFYDFGGVSFSRMPTKMQLFLRFEYAATQ